MFFVAANLQKQWSEAVVVRRPFGPAEEMSSSRVVHELRGDSWGYQAEARKAVPDGRFASEQRFCCLQTKWFFPF